MKAAIGRNASSATTLKRKTVAIAMPCSSRRAEAMGATAFTAEAPQIMVPPETRSAMGRRTPITDAAACVMKNALGSAAAATPMTSASSASPKS